MEWAMEIGLISDTHGYLDPRIPALFADCDEIWHAGDFGAGVVEALRQIRTLRAVFGNIDDAAIRGEFPEDLRFTAEGVDVWMTHIAGRPGRYESRVRNELKQNAPHLLICGHSHILHVQKDARFGGMQYLNPGAAGHHGFHLQRTVLKFTLKDGRIERIRLIELGPRGRRIPGAGTEDHSPEPSHEA
jgi:putative phosphoesterase